MIPVLFDIKIFTIYTFGVFLVLAFFWSSFLLWKLGRLTIYKEQDIFDGLSVSIVGALIGGRLVYIAFHFSDFGFDFLRYILINGYPGLSLPGCLLGGFVTLWLFCFFMKMKWSTLIDYAIAPLFLALGIGKLGAFLSGVEAGSQTKFILAMKYAHLDGLRHLTALYESLLFFVGCFIAYRLLFKIRREQLFRGFTMIFFMWLFSFIYLVFDPLKEQQILVGRASLYMYASAIVLLTTTVYFVYYWRNFLIHLFHVNKISHHNIHKTPEAKA